ncbi:hypothetical protein HD554DRAFT_1415824 [Boletus coccyginus]|nr:hypothetical protein HD554DRAFT_1415824 [Boletus coccyginus]
MGLYEKTIGTLLVGIFFNTFLYGLVTYQFAVYYQTQFNDRPAIKYMVLFLFVLDTSHSASAIYMAWYYTVTNYDNPAALAVNLWPYPFTPICLSLAALVTHIYLTIRIWRMTRSKILYGVAITLAIVSFILGMVIGVQAWTTKLLSELVRVNPVVIAWMSAQVTADIFITATLVIVFSRSRTGYRAIDTILNRFIRGAIQTGFFASTFSLGNLITFVLLPNTNFYGMFAIPIGRIYTNTLLDTLLTRDLLKVETNGAGKVTQSVVFDTVCWRPTDTQTFSIVQSTSIQPKSHRTTQRTCEPWSSEGAEGKVIPLEV